jgi:eukaryotic-like serine/threonine-protein kinase
VSHTWEQFVGQVVDGNFPLLQFLGGSESAAVFLTERHDGDRIVKAAIKLIPAAPENNELQLARWRMAAELSHPHLIRLFETGTCELGGLSLLYVVMECAEENLAQVLFSRALTPAEARAMLEPLLDVLAYVHAKGLVHGHIKPANIMAIGDELKLSSDALLRAGESAGSTPDAHVDAYGPPESAPGFVPPAKGVSPAGDVWSLGMTLVEVLTQHLPASDAAGQGNDLPLPAELPEPFLDIARHSLAQKPEDRWTVTQIAARLENRAPAPQLGAPAPDVRTPPRPAQQPPRPQAAPVQRPRANRHANRYAVPVAVGIVLLAAILFAPKLFRRHSEIAQAPAATIQEPAAQPAPPPLPQLPLPAQDDAAVRPASDAAGPGEVIERVLPDVPPSARNTIQGTVRVTVRVDVDTSGDVQFAELAAPGPSKYFSTLAMQAAQHWGFQPPKVSGQSILSTWTLRFEFTRSGTTVTPTQVIP